MQVSILKPNTIHPTEEYIQKCGKEKNGTLLEQWNLNNVLQLCSKLDKATEKHQNGSIFPYINPTLGKNTWIDKCGNNDGVIFIDIDNITHEVADKIYNAWEELCIEFPCLYAIQFSSSYYLYNDKAGLHIYVASGTLNEFDYKYLASLSLMIFARIVLKLLNIDLRNPLIDNENILDDHNTLITQRFFLYYSEFKINDDYILIRKDIVDKDTINKLKAEYPKIYLNDSIKIPVKINLDMTDGDNHAEKICIDRNFKIGNYSGNDIRWRISRIAQHIFGDGAKSWCDKYFYCEGNKSIYTKQNSTEDLSGVIKEWLEMNGYLSSKTENLIRNGEYITKYKNKILDFIKTHRHAEINGPTGTGKTTLINGVKNYQYDLFNSNPDMVFSLAHELNAIVIVPFNVTNKLYDNMIEISSDNDNKIKEDEPAVMIWDQAIIHWGEIKDRMLIIDEAHCLFLDRRYRDKAVLLMNKLKEDNCRYVLFTATPSGEGEELNCDYLKFVNERPYIHTDFINVDNVDVSQYRYIVNCLNNKWFDKIVLFDDTSAKKIYEKLYCDGDYINDIAYIRADTKNSDDFINLRNNELLDKRLTICTCVAFNGLNFKNKNENILVITSYQQGNTTASEIIQEAGRIRNSNVYLRIFYDNVDRTDDLEEHINKAEIMHNAEVLLDIPEGLLPYNHKLVDEGIKDALRNINEYLNKNSDIEVIIDTLLDTGYFVIKKTDCTNPDNKQGNRMILSLKKKESNEFIKDLLNDEIFDKEYDEKYKKEWQHQINKIINNDTYAGVTLDTFKDFYNNSDKQTLISTVIQKIYKAINISLIDDNSWKNYTENIDKIKLLESTNPLIMKQISSSFKENCRIRNKYKDKIIIKENNVIDLTFAFEDIISEMGEKQKSTKIAQSKAGSKGKTVVIEGKEYTTIKDAAIELNTSRSQIYRMIK